MEYAATVGDSRTTDNIKQIEAVQRKAARFVTGDFRYTSSVTATMESLSWETLQHRRQQAKAIMMFRVVHAMVAILASPYLQLLLEEATSTSTKSHIAGPRNIKNPFSRQASDWNQLPEELTTAESLETFKAGISAATHP